ncbi:MAG: apolipoprotein N-acyltransferase [Mariniblastus sp.]|nr:apolipoprotein N-acyltransferase [Mariniblastus sp.]
MNGNSTPKPENESANLGRNCEPNRTPLKRETHPRQILVVTLIGSLLLWLAFPPVGLWPLGWIATVPFMFLVAKPSLTGRRPYRQIWLAGFLYWLGTFYFIPIPHWALWAGWLVVSFYLSLYLPLFVFAARVLVHQLRFPVVLAGPMVWVGIEWLRSNLLTGMAMVCLSHTQYTQPHILQIADLFGGYTLTFLMAVFAAALVPWAHWSACGNLRARWVGAVVAGSVLTAIVMYGHLKLQQNWTVRSDSPNEQHSQVEPTEAHVALIQGSIDTEFPKSEAEQTVYLQKRDQEYFQLSQRAVRDWPRLDLMIWPESSFPYPDFSIEGPMAQQNLQVIQQYRVAAKQVWSAVNRGSKQPIEMLVGTTAYADDSVYNAAILLDRNGETSTRYFKNHRVMFGEYVPFADWFPLLQELTPIGRGLTAGTQPASFEVHGVTFAPNICFESTVPHLIRRQVNQLTREGNPPDVLVNITNDGWFFGTSCLDLHLACNVFRAVEMRKTNLVCANTGFSAHIDPHGKILQQGPRRDTATMRALVSRLENTNSLYQNVGDVPVMIIGLGALGLGLLIGWFRLCIRSPKRTMTSN